MTKTNVEVSQQNIKVSILPRYTILILMDISVNIIKTKSSKKLFKVINNPSILFKTNYNFYYI